MHFVLSQVHIKINYKTIAQLKWLFRCLCGVAHTVSWLLTYQASGKMKTLHHKLNTNYRPWTNQDSSWISAPDQRQSWASFGPELGVPQRSERSHTVAVLKLSRTRVQMSEMIWLDVSLLANEKRDGGSENTVCLNDFHIYIFIFFL